MEWTDSKLGHLALTGCSICGGTGVQPAPQDELAPCGCVLRNVFRACYARFRACAEGGKSYSRISFDRVQSGRTYRGFWGRKDEEYLADFELVARRSLERAQYKLFRYHFLLGADWKLCCQRLKVSRGAFFRAIAAIETTLGCAFSSLEPYAIYPPNEYFEYHSSEAVKPSVPKPPSRAPSPWERLRPMAPKLEQIPA